MKHPILTLLVLTVSVFISGCRSTSSIDRKPAPLKPQAVRSGAASRRDAAKSGGDPFFDAVFHRKPQNYEENSSFTGKERKMLHDNDVRRDPIVRTLHERGQKERTGNKDWVFGTKDGSYF